MFDYMTAKEKAKEWEISQRRVAVFCKEGRVPGATIMGNMWIIPKDAKKPDNPRKIKKNK